MPVPPSTKYISDSDEVILEEQQQRIILVGNIQLHYAVTGMFNGFTFIVAYRFFSALLYFYWSIKLSFFFVFPEVKNVFWILSNIYDRTFS